MSDTVLRSYNKRCPFQMAQAIRRCCILGYRESQQRLQTGIIGSIPCGCIECITASVPPALIVFVPFNSVLEICNAFDATTWYRSYYTISPTLNPDKPLITSWSIAPEFCGSPNPAPKWKIKPRVWSKRVKRFPITEPIPARSRF